MHAPPVVAADWLRTDPRVLSAASRGFGDRLRSVEDDREAEQAAFGGGSFGWFAYAPTGPGRGHVHVPRQWKPDDLDVLLGLGPPILHRLAATVATHWTARLAARDVPPETMPALDAALTGRVWAALEEWTGRSATSAEVELLDAGPSRLVREGDCHRVELPFGRLSSVWAPRLAVVADRFVLDARRDGPDVRLDTVDHDGGREAITLRLG